MNRRIKTKNIILSLIMAALFLGSSPGISYAGSWNGWIYQNPYPTSNTLLAVKFITRKIGWVAGEMGRILHTEDSGETWEAQESGTEIEIRSLSFISDKVGWAVGDGGVIINTIDGGKNWLVQESNTTSSLNSVYFINDKEGWAAGNEGTVIHTIDGGNKWEKTDVRIARSIASVYFLDKQTGWLLAGHEVYRTTDRGKKWELSRLDVNMPISGRTYGILTPSVTGRDTPPDWSRGDIFFSDNKNGWAVVGTWQIFRSSDGGMTWESKDLGFLTYHVGKISFIDQKQGCAGGTSIFCTEDGGNTWNERLGTRPGSKQSAEGFSADIQAITFTDQSAAWAVGYDGLIIKTEDGGKNWKARSAGGDFIIFSYFLDAKTGWAVKSDRKRQKDSIVRTDDGGYTWKVQKQFDARVESRFSFIDANTGWAVGQETGHDSGGRSILSYFILHTEDGGKSWKYQLNVPSRKAHEENDLRDVFFINRNNGWVTGNNGVILHTEDGGGHWTHQKSNTKMNVKKVAFFSEQKGLALAGNGIGIIEFVIDREQPRKIAIAAVFKTDDGGRHWHKILERKTTLFENLFLFNKSNALITAETPAGVLILFTSDGGKTWTEREVSKDISLSSSYFLDRDRGVLFDDDGWVYITKDGGKTWGKERQPVRPYSWHASELFKVQER